MWASPAKRLMLSGTLALTMLGGLGAVASAAQANFLPPPPGRISQSFAPLPGRSLRSVQPLRAPAPSMRAAALDRLVIGASQRPTR